MSKDGLGSTRPPSGPPPRNPPPRKPWPPKYVPPRKRFKIVSDNDGHQYACPVDVAELFYQQLEVLEAYWRQHPGDEPEQFGPEPPDPSDLEGVIRIDGTFTFTDPRTK